MQSGGVGSVFASPVGLLPKFVKEVDVAIKDDYNNHGGLSQTGGLPGQDRSAGLTRPSLFICESGKDGISIRKLYAT